MPIFNLMASTDMGLLDTAEAKLRGLLGYIEANTPRSTRPVAKPGKVINEGLINPNKYNATAANRFKDSAFGLLGVVPGVGDYASAAESADLFNRGENFAGGVAALGALPLVPAIGGMFIGKGAKTWDAIKAQQAEEMLAKGVDPREVWKQTGTLKGVDGAWRQEIPDNAAAFTKNATKDLAAYGARKEGSIFKHGELYDAYPETADIIALRARGNDYSGYYTDQGDNIGLTFPDKKPDMESLKSLNVHELQHAIQQREGWARGGSPENALDEWYGNINGRLSEIVKGMDEIPEWVRHTDPQKASAYQSLRSEYDKLLDMKLGIGDGKPDAHEMYRRLAGEAEARLTQARMGMNMDERLASYPYDMLDVPQEQLIVRGLLK